MKFELHYQHPDMLLKPSVPDSELAKWTIPPMPIDKVYNSIDKWAEKQKKYKLGLFIARLQPMHFGHVKTILEAIAISEKISIVIGSTNVFDENNLWPYTDRKKMVERMIEQYELTDRILNIAGVKDYPDDQVWFNEIQRAVKNKPFEFVIGNNTWVNEIFKYNEIDVVSPDLLQRETFEGKKIRNEMREKGILPKYVPALSSYNQLNRL